MKILISLSIFFTGSIFNLAFSTTDIFFYTAKGLCYGKCAVENYWSDKAGSCKKRVERRDFDNLPDGGLIKFIDWSKPTAGYQFIPSTIAVDKCHTLDKSNNIILKPGVKLTEFIFAKRKQVPWWYILDSKKCLEVDRDTHGEIFEILADESNCNNNANAIIDNNRTIAPKKDHEDAPSEQIKTREM